MNLYEIKEEYYNNGRISLKSVEILRQKLSSDSPNDAITIATDCAVFSLSSDIAKHLNSDDEIVRENAAGSLFTRFRKPEYLEKAIEMVFEDEDDAVVDISIVGVGELLPYTNNRDLSQKAARMLIDIFEHPNNVKFSTQWESYILDEFKEAAYFGILAAMDVLPLDRPSAAKDLDFNKDIDSNMIEGFKNKYL